MPWRETTGMAYTGIHKLLESGLGWIATPIVHLADLQGEQIP